MEPDSIDGCPGRRSEKKRISVISRLESFYCAPEDNGDFIDADFGLGDIPAELLEQAADLLFFLETTDWKWDINTLLDQPSDLFHAILKLMIAGNKLKKQHDKETAHE